MNAKTLMGITCACAKRCFSRLEPIQMETLFAFAQLAANYKTQHQEVRFVQLVNQEKQIRTQTRRAKIPSVRLITYSKQLGLTRLWRTTVLTTATLVLLDIFQTTHLRRPAQTSTSARSEQIIATQTPLAPTLMVASHALAMQATAATASRALRLAAF